MKIIRKPKNENELGDRNLLGIITPAALAGTVIAHNSKSDRERPFLGIGVFRVSGYRGLPIAKLPDPGYRIAG